MEKKTPLYDVHVKHEGTIVPFGGFLLPVQYPAGIKKEHMAVRTKAGLFDVSHMGEILVKGEKSLDFLNLILTNDYTDLKDGFARYSPMCNENGGTVDDLIVYKKAENDYFVVVNASNTDKDYAWMCNHVIDGVELKNASDEYGQIALQGPESETILKKICDEKYIPQKYYSCIFDGNINNINVMISRTGYTGEDGFEIYMPSDKAAEIWDLLMEAGSENGLIPCGLGARDTLRMEASMPLYGHELDDDTNLKVAGLGFAIKMDKPDFIGKKALEENTDDRKRTGLKVTGRGILREHCDVYRDGRKIGKTTSGTFFPYFKCSYAMALVEGDAKEIGALCQVDVRGKMIDCEMVKMPFYKREK